LDRVIKQFDGMYNLFNNQEWDIYTFEPNPHIDLSTMFNDVQNLTKIPKAIWTEDTKLSFSCKGKKDPTERDKYNEQRFQGGGSQLTSTNHQKDIPTHIEIDNVFVDAIDFSKFLLENKDKYEHIYAKFDVEGAEFQIIDKLIQDDTLKYIDMLYMEPHRRFFFQQPEWSMRKTEIDNIESELLNKCKQHTNVKLWS
jgi:FkbM family methyltransferase